MKKLPDIITIKEFKKIKAQTKNPKHKLAFNLGFGLGLRVSEVLNLRLKDVDLGRKLVKVRQGKGGKDRYVGIPKGFKVRWNLLPLTYSRQYLTQLIKRCARKAGIDKRIYFHTLRHSCATKLLKSGWDIRTVQQQLGHASISTTQLYTQVSPDDLVKQMEKTIWEDEE